MYLATVIVVCSAPTFSMQSVDVGPSLTQVLSLSPFKPSTMAVSGARRLAAVVRQ